MQRESNYYSKVCPTSLLLSVKKFVFQKEKASGSIEKGTNVNSFSFKEKRPISVSDFGLLCILTLVYTYFSSYSFPFLKNSFGLKKQNSVFKIKKKIKIHTSQEDFLATRRYRSRSLFPRREQRRWRAPPGTMLCWLIVTDVLFFSTHRRINILLVQ